METVKSNTTKSRKVRIANPLYDYAFKYLMDDNHIARKLVSAIVGEKVIKLTSAPLEYKSMYGKLCVVFRLNFIAKIRTDERVKTVIVEVYKVSLLGDNKMFIRYLESRRQMRKLEKREKESDKETYCIFILPNGTGIKDMPVVKVNIENDVNNYELPDELSDESIDFIKQLHHPSWIIQVPELKNRHSNDIEVLLSIFDQTNKVEGDNIFLNVKEENFPKKYRPVILRLERAASNDPVCNTIREEDYLLGHLRMAEIKMLEERAAKEAALAKIAALKAQSNTEKTV
jgi:hypothetical protein